MTTNLHTNSETVTPNSLPLSDELFIVTKSNGVKMQVRKDRHAYFYPSDWVSLLNCLTDEQQILFNGLLQTGARIDEWLHVKPKDFDWKRNIITLRTTKTKHKLGETKATGGRSRSFRISKLYSQKIMRYIVEYGILEDAIIFNYTRQGVTKIFKHALIKANINNSHRYSLHNIRKTTGMWLKTLQSRGRDLDVSEICMRLGHDHNTFLKHYGSPSVFTDTDRNEMIKILGDVYDLH
jgi:integrase